MKTVGLGFVDRILKVNETTIWTQKNLSVNEDYLQDHFPAFPVMPGVLMVQAAVESAGWWLKHQHDFKVSGICLKEVQNARFASFLSPGQVLVLEVQVLNVASGDAYFQVKARREESVVLSFRFKVNYQNLEEILENQEAIKWETIERANFNILFRPL